ncbi:class I SAM-dependent methyltransferase [Marmoricola sp. RAF53]|uniref:class I SAM-dependent methyltransferase n=1 Tax=Marmoricola sp. RAF53 TaxID=3233059 RepID=UPI003F9BD955
MDLDAFRWLLTPEGQRLLARAADAPADPLRASASLRRHGTAEQVAAALTQARLRERAADKFGDLAARMYFTPDGLEQATRQPVAEHRAARLVAAGTSSVIDLGCGIGGDLVAAARAGITAAGVDLDPLRVEVARANLAALDLGGAVAVADATTVDHSPFDVAFADPARRSARGRSFVVDDWTPPWPFVEDLLRRTSCVKVAPGIPHALVPAGVEAEWVSDHGEVKEAALWSGALATVARRATVIGSGGLATLTEEDDPGAEVRAVGDYLYEPDGAVIRAGLVTAVAAGVGGGLVDPHIAYVTADDAFRTPFARSYRVVEELPYREKQLRAALRERGIGRLTIKKRGVDVVPEELRKRLAPTGDAEGTIVLTRVAGQGTCLLVQPF